MTQSTAAIQDKRRAAVDKAKITWNRNTVLRRSAGGRLLLALERCMLANSEREMSSRRFSWLLSELRYACKLADEAGVRHGWVKDELGLFSVAFELSSGEVSFSTFSESVGKDPFPRRPNAGNNPLVLTRAIAETLAQETESSLRRSTRIPTGVPIEVKRDGFAYGGETITVNLHGALVRVAANLKLGDRVTLYVNRTGKYAAGAVVFANDSLRQFGIELQNPENIWGVALPPPDWST